MIKELKKETFTLEKALDAFIKQNNKMSYCFKTEFEFLKWIDEGRLVVIGGGSGLGKTTFTLQMLYELVRDNQDREDNVIGIYVSAEMMVEELIMRLIVNQQILEDINMLNIRKYFNSKLIQQKQFEKNIKKTNFILSNIPFFFLNAHNLNLQDIIQIIKKTREKNKNQRIFIVIDYLQLLLTNTTDLKEMNTLIKELKNCLIENKANAIVISSLNRDAIKNNYVNSNAFKDSGMIEYSSDIAILFAFKNEKGKYTLKIDEEKRNLNTIEFYAYCVKNRIGKLFSDKLIFNKLKQRFEINPIDVVSQEEFKKQNNKNQINKKTYKKLSVHDII